MMRVTVQRDWSFRNLTVMNEIVLVPQMSPVISARGAAVPTFLPTMSEMFSSAVLAGGGVVAEAAPLAVVGAVTARVSVLREVGSYADVDDTLDMVGLHVGQSCFRPDSEDSVRNCLIRPDTVLVNQDFVSTDNRGDDQFSPGVRIHVSLDW